MAFPLVRGPFLVGLLAIGALGAGCSLVDQAKQQAGSNIASSLTNNVVSSLTGGRVGVTATGGQAVVVDKGSGTSYIAGEKIVLPADFPAEMMVYPGAKILFVTTGAEPTLSLTADEFADTVAAWYADKLTSAGWKEVSKLAAGGYESRSYSKNNITLSLTFLGSRESGSRSTAVSISRKAVK